jgi:hypothetical protein
VSTSPAEPAPGIGSRRARTIHGYTSHADCVLLGSAGRNPGLDEVLGQVVRPARIASVDELSRLAAIAGSSTGPLVLADAGLDLSLPATLDLLDVPGDVTSALVADPVNIEAPGQRWFGLSAATLARVGPDGTLVASGTDQHTVSNPNRVVVGLLRVAEHDRQRAAELFDDAAGQDDHRDLNLFDLALLALIRGGLVVKAVPLGYFDWARSESGADGIGSSPWRQRLRSASRLGDGAYSTAVIRPLSRLGTRLALTIDLSPNVITLISVAVGIGAGLLILTGDPVGWIAAAVLLQLALVIDCMDGEVARFTRRFSTFGAWLDGIGDRIKEYLVLAAVAAVAAREGGSYAWLLALIALMVVTARHLEDYSYTDRNAPDRVSTLRPRPVGEPTDGLDLPDVRTSLPVRPGRRDKIVFWAKKIAHVPIAERYLILSLGLLTLQPLVVLVAAITGSAFALTWTVGGRFLRALRTPRPSGGAELDRQLDSGRLTRRLRNRLTATPTRFGWLALPAVWVVEGAAVIAVWACGAPGWLAFLTLAVIAFRRYELIYSIRLGTGSVKPAALGTELRVLLPAAVVLLLYGVTGITWLLVAGLVVTAVATFAEAVGAVPTRSRAA